jgi:hypothetical protein
VYYIHIFEGPDGTLSGDVVSVQQGQPAPEAAVRKYMRIYTRKTSVFSFVTYTDLGYIALPLSLYICYIDTCLCDKMF